jgi:hypothetical protein
MEETSGLERTSPSRVEVGVKDGPESDGHETCRGDKGRKEAVPTLWLMFSLFNSLLDNGDLSRAKNTVN